MTPLTIGVDARAAEEEGAGRGRVVRELLRALCERDDPHRYVLYSRREWHEPLDGRFRWRLLPSRDPWWHLRAARAANRECDVFLSTNSYLTVRFLRVPAVPIVYDLIPFEPELRPNRRSVVIERVTLGPAVRRSALLLAISRATEDALVRHFPGAAGKVEVAPLGVSPALAAQEPPPGTPAGCFVLAVGTLEPRKNLPRLVEAYGRLPEELQAAHPLVVVGRTGWQTGETRRALESLGDRCRSLGFVSDAELAALYEGCTAFCYPSLGEGFGLPVLEAMAAGAPILTSSVASLRELASDAAEYADPRDAGSIAAGLRRLIESPGRRTELAERGRKRAEAFSWGRTAELVLRALERAGGR